MGQPYSWQLPGFGGLGDWWFLRVWVRIYSLGFRIYKVLEITVFGLDPPPGTDVEDT